MIKFLIKYFNPILQTKTLILLALVFPLTPFAVQAEEQIRQTQALWFGEIVITDNQTPQRMALDPNLGTVADSGIVIMQSGRPGIFFFDGFASNFLVNVSLEPASSLTSHELGNLSTPQFEIDPVLEVESFNTDINGQYELRIFGSLTSSGTGDNYIDGIYYRPYRLLINY